MKIRILYNRENSIIGNYWEYFFKSCGIYVEKGDFTDEQEPEKDVRCLAIRSPQDTSEYSHPEISHHACLLIETDTPDHDNIFSEHLSNNYIGILSCLFKKAADRNVLIKLFEIYSKNDFWKAVWLYEEFAKDDIRRWDKKIATICANVSSSIDNENLKKYDSRHVIYMQFYIRYILCDVKYRMLSERPLESEKLLFAFLSTADKYPNDERFMHLAGRICELHPVKNKHARFFYLQAQKLRDCSDYLYDIGHSIEKFYGDNERAVHYYKRAYHNDNNNYRALYKLAVEKELKRQWIDAFIYYGQIERQLQKIVADNHEQMSAASIRELDYLYKVYNRLLYIYTEILGCGNKENNYTLKITNFKEKILSGHSFEKLAYYMGVPKIRGEITDELLQKFQGKCYRYKL